MCESAVLPAEAPLPMARGDDSFIEGWGSSRGWWGWYGADSGYGKIRIFAGRPATLLPGGELNASASSSSSLGGVGPPTIPVGDLPAFVVPWNGTFFKGEQSPKVVVPLSIGGDSRGVGSGVGRCEEPILSSASKSSFIWTQWLISESIDGCWKWNKNCFTLYSR